MAEQQSGGGATGAGPTQGAGQAATQGQQGQATPDTDARFVSRRRFLTYVGVAGVGVAAGAALTTLVERTLPSGRTQTLGAYPQRRLANMRDLRQGEPVAFEYPLSGQPNYLVKLGTPALDGVGPQGDIVAFSILCAHMGCPLTKRYSDAQKILGPCPCHLSVYDLTLGGQLVSGAATEGLPQIELRLDANGEIFAEGVWGLIYGAESNLKG